MTSDELAALLADARLPPLAYDPAVGLPRFILHDGRGQRCGELLSKQATAQQLATTLRTIVDMAVRRHALVQPSAQLAK